MPVVKTTLETGETLSVPVILLDGMFDALGIAGHIGIGRTYGRPVIYLDKRAYKDAGIDLANLVREEEIKDLRGDENDTARIRLLKHELSEIRQMEAWKKQLETERGRPLSYQELRQIMEEDVPGTEARMKWLTCRSKYGSEALRIESCCKSRIIVTSSVRGRTKRANPVSKRDHRPPPTGSDHRSQTGGRTQGSPWHQ